MLKESKIETVAYWQPVAEQDTEAEAIGGPNFTMH